MLSVYPSDRAVAGLVLAHGAGGGQRSRFMLLATEALAARRITVATFDFAYMAEGRKVPDKAPVLEGRWRSAIEAARAAPAFAGLPLFIGGKSMGGRIASHVAVVGVLAPLSLYFLDTGLTIVVRMSRHESLMTAHRDHVYQRLVRLGWSHARSTAFAAALTVAISASATLRSMSGFAIAGSLMALYIAAPALVRLRLDTSTIVALVPLREGEHEERAA